jgi:transcriptional regulator with XRE-family HTH domain
MGKVDPRTVTEVDKEIGASLRVRRRELGLPMRFVADKVGVSQQQYQRYEAGLARVSALMLSKIAAALDVEPAQFLPGAPPLKRSEKAAARPDSLATQLQDAFARIQSTRERRLILALTKRFASSAPAAKKKARR